MNEKALKTLEYDKIIDMLTQHALTPLGKKHCAELLPMDDIRAIRTAQTETNDALTRIYKQGSLSFSGTRDIRSSLMRLDAGGTLSAIELLNISSVLRVADRARSYSKKEHDDDPKDSLDDYFSGIEPLTQLYKEIDRCILSEEEMADDASPALKAIRRNMQTTRNRVKEQLNSVMNSARTYLQDSVITMRGGRYCLPVRAEYKSQVSGMVHDQSATGSTFFIEPMSVVKLNNELRELEIQERKEIEVILANLSTQAAEHQEALAEDFRLLSYLDFVFAKAMLAKEYNGCQPQFNRKGRILIKKGRHPLIDKHKVVPIDVRLGSDFDLLIVTGPNTGGKTVSLKTVGLFTLMGQAGLQIPAFDGSELAVFREVYADIGDEQSIEQSLSTFSSHMTNIVSFIEKADQDSLVLFDELGAGTDPTEGAALATSILSFLHNMKVRTMATTHYSELKVFALSTEGVENASCEFNVETLSPTYRLLIGVPGKSNAFAISQKLGLPDYIIDNAKERIDAESERFEDVISELQSSRIQIEEDKLEIARRKEAIRQLQQGLEKKQGKIDAQKDRILKEAREEAQSILQEAKDYADETIRIINKKVSAGGVSKELETERTALRGKLNQVSEQLSVKPEPKPKKKVKAERLHIGDKVRVLSLNLTGTVSTLPNAKGDLFVQMGILRSSVNVNDIELMEETTVSGPGLSAPKSQTSAIKMSKSYEVSPEINLIGMTVDEAMAALDKYLDDAILAHLSQIRIVHGRGTGALKNAVHKKLKGMSQIKSYRLGIHGEGDTGVTIAEFR